VDTHAIEIGRMSRAPSRPGRRNNAPVRPPRQSEGSSIPDVLFCLASGAFVLAVILLAATLRNEQLTAGDVGKELAEFFALALIGAAVFLFLVGILLLRNSRGQANHYVTPILLGIIGGAIEAVLVIEPAGFWIAAPLIVLVFALRPVRRWFGRIAGQQRQPAQRR
jgi:hypothetical protein